MTKAVLSPFLWGVGLLGLALSFPVLASLLLEAESEFFRALAGVFYMLFYFCSFVIGMLGALCIVFAVGRLMMWRLRNAQTGKQGAYDD